MRVVLVHGRDLLSADRNGLSDPYAILRLNGKKKKSKKVMKTLNPDWHQEFEFSGPVDTLRSLKVELWDYDQLSFSGDDTLGGFKLDLSAAIDTPIETVTFDNIAVEKPGKGTVTIRATFSPDKPQIRGGDSQDLGEDDPDAIDATITESNERDHGTLKITLLSAKELLAADKGGTSDPYVKFTCSQSTQKSSVVAKTLNPTWTDQTFEWVGSKTTMGLLDLAVFDRDVRATHTRTYSPTRTRAADRPRPRSFPSLPIHTHTHCLAHLLVCPLPLSDWDDRRSPRLGGGQPRLRGRLRRRRHRRRAAKGPRGHPQHARYRADPRAVGGHGRRAHRRRDLL